jgi:hypothetical protein
VSDGAAQSVPSWRCADQAKDAGVACCLTFAASRDRVPSRCGIALPPTPSQGRAGATSNWCAQRLRRLAQRACPIDIEGLACQPAATIAGGHVRDRTSTCHMCGR